MLTKDQICPYSREYQKYKNMDCRKLENFWECEGYIDFELESSGKHDDIIKFVIEELSKIDKTKKKSKKSFEKCPYKLNCYLIFEKPCNNRRLSNDCHISECEDCELNIHDYGKYCETVEYGKCESFEVISILKEGYESIGVHSTEDLKEHFGEENYEWLGGYIRCAFMEPEDII